MRNAKSLFILVILSVGSAPFFAHAETTASAKDVAIATGLTFTVNVFFNSADRILLEEDYAEVNPQSFKKNLTHAWWWDIDNYATNQLGHPYQGSLYFTAGRANGLTFWQSLALAGFGSLTWEEFGETDSPSVNDIITTPLCGAVVGETLHRLYIDANELCPALAWLLSPMDGLTHALTGKNPTVAGHTEEVALLFHGGAEYSQTDFSDATARDDMKKAAGGGAIHVQYGNPIAHSAKEAFDVFTLDVDSAFSANYYKAAFSIDGFLWSQALYFEDSEGTFGVDLLYEGEWASTDLFSNAAVGIKYLYEDRFSESDGRFSFFAQIDCIFMGTRSLYSLYKNRADYEDLKEPPRFYNFGYGALAKFGFSVETERFGTVYAETGADFLLPFAGSEVKESKYEKSVMSYAKIGYEHKITQTCSLGVRDTLTYKADWYKAEADTVQILNSAQLYGKISLTR